MSHPGPIDRLREPTANAVARYGRQQAERERRDQEPPRPGDVFAFAESAPASVLWAIVEQGPNDAEQLVAVPLDLHPLVGTTDVALPDDEAFGAGVLRLKLEVPLKAAAFEPARRVGFLEPRILEQVRRKRAALAADTWPGSELEQETEAELAYQDRLQEVSQARAELLQAAAPETVPELAARPAEETGVGDVVAFPSAPPRVAFARWYALAASILLAVTLGGLLSQKLRIDRLTRTVGDLEQSLEDPARVPVLVNATVEWLYPDEDHRSEGDPHVLRLPATSPALVLVLQIVDAEPYPAYRLKILAKASEREAWSSEELTEFQPQKVSVVLPRDRLPAGDYWLELYGMHGGRQERIADYALRLERGQE